MHLFHPATFLKRWVLVASWLALWSTIGVGPWILSEPGPGWQGALSVARLLAPVAALLLCAPLLAAIQRPGGIGWAERGLWWYAASTLIGAILFRLDMNQIYWSVAYLGALSVAAVAFRRHSLAGIALLSATSWAASAALLLVMLALARDLLFAEGVQTGYNIVNRYQEARGGLIARSSGFSRLAAVPAIVALVFLSDRRVMVKAVSAAVLAFSLYIIWFMQSRGALVAFAGAFLFVIYFGRNGTWKLTALTMAFLAVLLLAPDETVYGLWDHASRAQGLEGFSTMSGRRDLWSYGFTAFWESPMFGYGPQADRIFIGENASNALIYALLSGGVVGTTFYATALVATFYHLLKVKRLFHLLRADERLLMRVSGGIFVFSMLRSVPENHATVYSVDLLLQLPAMLAIVHLSHVLSGRRRHAAVSASTASFGPTESLSDSRVG